MKLLVPILVLLVLVIAGRFLIPTSKPTSLYGQVLFGTETDNPEAWMHVIVEGNDRFIDKNKNAIAEKTELLASNQELTHQVGNRKFTVSNISLGIPADAVSESFPQRLLLTVQVHDKRPFTMTGQMQLVESADDCNWLQFGGDLRFLSMGVPELRAGAAPSEVKIFVGTVTDGPPNSEKQLHITDVAKSESKIDIFRSTIVVPNQSPPFPTIALEINGSDSATKRISMDRFC